MDELRSLYKLSEKSNLSIF